jgi:hypothetical protein
MYSMHGPAHVPTGPAGALDEGVTAPGADDATTGDLGAAVRPEGRQGGGSSHAARMEVSLIGCTKSASASPARAAKYTVPGDVLRQTSQTEEIRTLAARQASGSSPSREEAHHPGMPGAEISNADRFDVSGAEDEPESDSEEAVQQSLENMLQQSLENIDAQMKQAIMSAPAMGTDPLKLKLSLARLQKTKARMQDELNDLQIKTIANRIRNAMTNFKDKVHSNISQWIGIPTLEDSLKRALHAMPRYDEEWQMLADISASSKTSLVRKLMNEEVAVVDGLAFDISQSDKGLDANMQRMQEMLRHLEQFAEEADPSVKRRQSVAQRKMVRSRC